VRTCFISDLHLSENCPHLTRLFLDFLERGMERTQALYILGDLFEVWVGDDEGSPLHTQVAAALHRLASLGTAVHLMHGNRDFLVGPAFEAASGVRILPEPAVVVLEGERALLMHGDALCTDDVAYQRFRAQVRKPAWQRLFLSLPLALRRRIARRARESSSRQTAKKSEDIMDVSPSEVAAVMRRWGVSTLIHGHTHQPGVHPFRLDGRPALRVVLGAWADDGSVLVWERDRRELVRWTLGAPAVPAVLPT
jgi:UDP-2,3-diacylglucosamine hydrolase